MNDWPLAVCDAAAVDKTTDLEAADLLYPDLATENYQVYYKPEYKWYYLSSHDVSELMIFKQSDSLPDACPGMSFQVKATTPCNDFENRCSALLVSQSPDTPGRGPTREH